MMLGLYLAACFACGYGLGMLERWRNRRVAERIRAVAASPRVVTTYVATCSERRLDPPGTFHTFN